MRVGITGGIGSGKTTVCRVFETLGIPVYYADAEAKRLYSENKDLQAALLNAYGPEVLQNGEVNKVFLRSLVFGKPEAARKLNSLVHPFVFEHYEQWCLANENKPYTIKEAAILFESGSYKRIHRVIGVVAPEALRIQRAMNRDHCSREDVLQRMQKQLPQDELAKKCQYLIHNDEGQSIIEQVRDLHRKLLEESTLDWPYLT